MTLDDTDQDRNDDATPSKILTDSLRKAVVTGLSAVFMTEEGIRNLFNDMRVPKEAMSFLVQQTERSRRELFRIVSDELKGFLRGIDLPGEVRRSLAGLKVELKAEVRFVDEGATQASVSTTVKSAADPSSPSATATIPSEESADPPAEKAEEA